MVEVPMRLGMVTRRWSEKTDEGIFEYREKLLAIAECPVCGEQVALLGETDAWVESRRVHIDARAGKTYRYWSHDSYGPALAEHCGKLIADWWEGTFVYDLEPSA